MVSPGIPESLRRALNGRKVIPFVGAGVSMSVTDTETGVRLFPSWKELLERAADRLEEEKKIDYALAVRALLGLPDPDYIEVAEKARKGLGHSVWFDFLKDQIDRPPRRAHDRSLELARAIWQLGSRLVITTNYDRVMDWACPDQLDLRRWSVEAPVEMVAALRSGMGSATIWNLHGRIDDAAKIILTAEGYKNLYPENGAPEAVYQAALATLRSLLASQTLLFIGFSMDDPALGLQLRDVDKIFKGSEGPHYVVVVEAQVERVRALRLPVEIVPVQGFGEPLLELVRAMGSEARRSGSAAGLGMGASSPSTVGPYDPNNRIFHVPYPPKGDQVIGRARALEKLRYHLTRGRRTAIGHAASFNGLGGLGKDTARCRICPPVWRRIPKWRYLD